MGDDEGHVEIAVDVGSINTRSEHIVYVGMKMISIYERLFVANEVGDKNRW